MSFDRLQTIIDKMKNPTVVGLDPDIENIPPEILERHISEKGETLEAAAAAAFEFNTGLIDTLCDIVPAVKPQSAFYEAFGPEGVLALKRTCGYAKSKGMYVICDGKRNDIGSTVSAYSAAYLGAVKVGSRELRPFDFDALTVNAYLGSDGLRSFIETSVKYDKAVFVLLKTSNASAGELQDMYISEREDADVNTNSRCTNGSMEGGSGDAVEGGSGDAVEGGSGDAAEDAAEDAVEGAAEGGSECNAENCSGGKANSGLKNMKTLYTAVGDLVEELAIQTTGKYGYTRAGAVVGATYPEEIVFLRNRLRYTFFLVPGYGAQGGSATDVACAFDGEGRGAIVNSSRAIIAAWKKTGGDYQAAAREEALKMRDALQAALRK